MQRVFYSGKSSIFVPLILFISDIFSLITLAFAIQNRKNATSSTTVSGSESLYENRVVWIDFGGIIHLYSQFFHVLLIGICFTFGLFSGITHLYRRFKGYSYIEPKEHSD